MFKRTPIFATATAIILAGSVAMADSFSDRVIENLQAEGFTGIEVKNGLTQTKVEAVRGDRKLEVIYDRATGSILKQEWEAADANDLRDGVEVQSTSRDFVDDGDDDGEDHTSGTDDSGSGGYDDGDDDHDEDKDDDDHDDDENDDTDDHDEDDDDDDDEDDDDEDEDDDDDHDDDEDDDDEDDND
ncbi:hypothetical protein [Pseudaestuariivita atlantica]|uniref:PepSY domain-containing protein n=1 Tax=Pseudaestuariivita atlantica TaxID=1317121 RepID=A0A0L1JTY3_9RHOB|nr:hypothetical protein [Pseudaestuariivita atlantica]KNG95210.1 hypothetical protein ATO11_00775 [Pseudaestuariivita atlantica]